MVKKKAGTITFAIGLIIVGALLFAENFTTLPIKDFYKYWPVLLIGLGAEFLIFSIIYSRENGNVKLSIDGLCVAFIIILGIISNTGNIMNLDMNFGDKGKSLLDFNSKYKTEIKETFSKNDISASYSMKEVKVSNDFGKIEVKPSDTKSMKVEAKIRLKCNDEAKAREYIKNAIYIKEGEVTEISVNRPEDENKNDFSKAIIDFTIFIPNDAKLDIENSFGEIAVLDTKGGLTINNSYGAVAVSGITGNTIIKNSFGKIDVDNINGDVNISNQNGQISVEKVVGSADVGGSFGNIGIKDIGGSLNIRNNNGRIDIKDVGANANIKNSFGSINYTSSNIKDAQILAKTDFGSVRCDIGISITKTGQQSKAEGKTGSGKNKIEIINTSGDINID